MLKKIILAAAIAVSSNHFSNAMNPEPTFTMPDEQTLTALFSKFGMDHFVEKTQAPRLLANKKLFADGIEIEMHFMICKYAENLRGTAQGISTRLLMQSRMSFDAIIDTLLQNHPGVKAELALLRATEQ